MIISHYSSSGRRDYNEDFFDVKTPTDDNPYYYFGLYDGHGGDFVSKYLKDNIKLPQNVNIQSLQKMVTDIQDDLTTNHADKIEKCGSTLLACVFGNNDYFTINLGDCRMIADINNKAHQLTRDHKPSDHYEKERINKLNGGSSLLKYDESDDEYRVGALSVSKGIGDLDTKPYFSHIPAIAQYKLNHNYNKIIMGCDGIWDVVKNQEAIDHVNTFDVSKQAKELSRLAFKKKSYDNLTAIVINI